MSLPDNQSDAVFSRIHFDTLFRQSQEDITAYSGKIWTDKREHDPGITLLQALTWTTSDLAYRHTFPLVDLFTSADNVSKGVFPAAFNAAQVLTSAPVTVDDLRRGILDLPNDGKPNHDEKVNYHFRNAKVSRITDDLYTYYFNTVSGLFTFTQPKEGVVVKLTVDGDYVIEVERNRGVSKDEAMADLDEYLKKNDHPTESYVKKICPDPDIIAFNVSVELEDDWVNYPQTLKELLKVIDDYVRPVADRVAGPGEGIAKEDLYQGPLPSFGWITSLPPDALKTIDIRPLSKLILKNVSGVKSLQSLNANPGSNTVVSQWVRTVSEGKFPLPWGDNITDLSDSVQKHITFTKKGRVIDKAEYLAAGVGLFMGQTSRIITQKESVLHGRYRDPDKTYPTMDNLPMIYRVADQDRGTLSKLMLPFELWNYYIQYRLLSLPELFSFQRGSKATNDYSELTKTDDNKVRETFSRHYHYKNLDDIPGFSTLFHDEDRELNIIEHLLRYFGEVRAPRTLLNKLSVSDKNDYMKVQQGFLSQLASINYERPVIDIKRVFSLQRRIAARLGKGGKLFNENLLNDKTPLNNLPFYIVENRKLLPYRPGNAALKKMQDPNGAIAVKNSTIKDDKLVIECAKADMNGLIAGMLVNLSVAPKADTEGKAYAAASGSKENLINFNNLLIREIPPGKNELHFNLSDEPRLASNRRLFERNASVIQLIPSPVILRNKRFTFNKEMIDSTKRSLTLKNIPAWITPGTVLNVYKWASVLERRSQKPDLIARAGTKFTPLEVSSIDLLNNRVLLTKDISEDILTKVNKGTPDEEVYFEVMPSTSNEAFSSTLTFVFPHEWIDRTSSEITAWIEECVSDEIPVHLNHQIMYLDAQSFTKFGNAYHNWTKEGFELGGSAYTILSLLSLAERPSDSLQGIGVMRVASAGEKGTLHEQVKSMTDLNQKTTAMLDASLFFVGNSDQSY